MAAAVTWNHNTALPVAGPVWPPSARYWIRISVRATSSSRRWHKPPDRVTHNGVCYCANLRTDEATWVNAACNWLVSFTR